MPGSYGSRCSTDLDDAAGANAPAADNINALL
jgi:hypothetical protein